ncbi:HD-GYP domain-containing protein [Thiolapillus brandeum]|uniref:HD-GYP domain-containing protein n=1 Tax=Thiolapillus brandeum TaxID=1076588 RepID=UPI000698E4F7|nr:HD domain-containing phosphohydrolase [Thiolapillus brandeum]
MMPRLPCRSAISLSPTGCYANGDYFMDGSGYPRGLTGEELPLEARIMAIADIFEALTASDRPYKAPKKLSEVLRIMHHMKQDQHVDADLFELFLTSGVYRQYAEKYLAPDQCDEVDIREYLS